MRNGPEYDKANLKFSPPEMKRSEDARKPQTTFILGVRRHAVGAVRPASSRRDAARSLFSIDKLWLATGVATECHQRAAPLDCSYDHCWQLRISLCPPGALDNESFSGRSRR